jgi:hypothetical protein
MVLSSLLGYFFSATLTDEDPTALDAGTSHVGAEASSTDASPPVARMNLVV